MHIVVGLYTKGWSTLISFLYYTFDNKKDEVDNGMLL